jgi:hypothetical protein
MNRIDDRQIVSIATTVATANLGRSNFTSVLSGSTVDSTGREGLKITIVLAPGASVKVTGEKAVDMVFDINKKLQDAGEERFSIIHYST